MSRYTLRQQFENNSLNKILCSKTNYSINELIENFNEYNNNEALKAANRDIWKNITQDYNNATGIFALFGVPFSLENIAALSEAIRSAEYPIEKSNLPDLSPLQAFVFQYRPALDVRVLSESELATLAAEISAELTAQPE